MARERIWYHCHISLPYETNRETVRTIIDRIGSFLRGHAEVDTETARILFSEIGPAALPLNVIASVRTADYVHALQVAEELSSALPEIVERAGA